MNVNDYIEFKFKKKYIRYSTQLVSTCMICKRYYDQLYLYN